ncbi:MAG: tetratricopeptide repeat-containing sensor histidine kinase [Bacteroidetes bacterium]|nr:tetratricopeptide repeat-containing sensor histidine kinase [Bacteroidota bacterium]
MKAWQFVFVLLAVTAQGVPAFAVDRIPVERDFIAAEKDTALDRMKIRALIRESLVEHRRNAELGLKAGEHAYQRAVALGDTILQVRALNAIGANRWMRGEYDIAVHNHIEALRLAELLESRFDIGQSYNNLGLAYRNLGMSERAEDCFRRAAHIRSRMGDDAGLSRCLMNLGLIFYESARLDSSYALHEQSLQLARAARDTLLIAGNLYHLGRIENARGKAEVALVLMRKALSLYIYFEDRNGVSLVSSDIARVLFTAGRTDEARREAVVALENGLLLNSRFAIREAAQVLADIHAASKQYRKAYEYLTLFKATDDSLRDEAALRRVAQLNIEREIAVREKELAFRTRQRELEVEAKLRSQALIRNSLIAGTILLAILLSVLLFAFRGKLRSNRLITVQKQHIEDANAELAREIETRERLFGIVSHDLRGAMGNITGMLVLASADDGAVSAEQKAELLTGASETANATLALLNRLLDWARAQRKEIQFNPVVGDLREIAAVVMKLLQPQARSKQIQLDWFCPSTVPCSFDEHMLTVILENLLSNAIKFTGEKGRVELRIERSGTRCTIRVSDNGSGITAERLERIRNRSGIVPDSEASRESAHGLGLDLCHRFVALHGGEIHVESEVGIGSVFTVTIPLVQEIPQHSA